METTTTVIATTDGRELCVESGGDPSGYPVLVHGGTPNSRRLEDRQLSDAEQRGIHLMSYDRPGYGGSTPKPGRSVADCAEDARSIARAFKIDAMAMWGISGGGPHVLACAALLPDLIVAAASLASIAPYGQPDLDYFGGMGKDNVDDITLYLNDPDAARKKSREDCEGILLGTSEQMIESMASLISPADMAALTPELASFLLASFKDSLAPGDQGWWDDGVAHLAPWGFVFEDITIPVQLWHGKEDRFVPFQHGQWLAKRIPGVEAHLTESDGHLTLLDRVPEIHQWLLQFS